MLRQINAKKLMTSSFIYVIFFVATLMAMFSFLTSKNVMLVWDAWFHVSRIHELAGLPLFEWPNYQNFTTFNQVGLPVNATYPWQTLYPFILLTSIFGSVLTKWKVIVFLITFFSLSWNYFAFYKTSNNKLLAFLFAYVVTYINNGPVYLIYQQGSLGNAIANVFVSSAILGLYLIIRQQKQKMGQIFLVVGVLGAVYSHVLSFILLLVTLLIVFILQFIVAQEKKQIVIDVLKAAGIALLMALPVIVPIAVLEVSNTIRPGNAQVLTGQSLLSYLLPNYVDLTTGLLGAAAIIAITYQLKRLRQLLPELLLLLGAIILFLIDSQLFPWAAFQQTLGANLQFTWRILYFGFVLVAIASLLLINHLDKKRSSMLVILLSVYTVGLSFSRNNMEINLLNTSKTVTAEMVDKFPTQKYDGYSLAPDYKFPVGIDANQNFYQMMSYAYFYPKAPVEALPDRQNFILFYPLPHTLITHQFRDMDKSVLTSAEKFNAADFMASKIVSATNQTITFQLDLKKDIKNLGLPVLYYKGNGYKITVNGDTKAVQEDNVRSTLAISAVKKGENTITVTQITPSYEYLLWFLAYLTPLAIILFSFRKKLKNFSYQLIRKKEE